MLTEESFVLHLCSLQTGNLVMLVINLINSILLVISARQLFKQALCLFKLFIFYILKLCESEKEVKVIFLLFIFEMNDFTQSVRVYITLTPHDLLTPYTHNTVKSIGS